MESCYFAAVDDEGALGVIGGGSPAAPDGGEVVAADGVIPVLAIPRLLALASDSDDARLDPAVVTHVWPRMPEDPGADLSWMAEPIVERLSPSLRDGLAELDLSRAGELAERWGRVIHWPTTECEQLVGDLVALARRAREQGRPVYSRYTLGSAGPGRRVDQPA